MNRTAITVLLVLASIAMATGAVVMLRKYKKATAIAA
jgi:hypothetical protein